MSRKKKVNDEVLQMIIKCARREISESGAARNANVGHTTMELWVTQYTSEGITAFTYEHNNSYPILSVITIIFVDILLPD